MSTLTDVFALASKRLTATAADATTGPWRPTRAVPGALRCADVDGEEAHVCYGAERDDLRLMVGFDPDGVRRVAAVLNAAAASDACAPELADLVNYLSQKMGLQLPEAILEPPLRRPDWTSAPSARLA